MLFVVIGLVLSAVPASAQRANGRPASGRSAVATRPADGRATLPIIRTDRSWRNVGRSTSGQPAAARSENRDEVGRVIRGLQNDVRRMGGDYSWRRSGGLYSGHYPGIGRSLLMGVGVGMGVGLVESLVMRQQMNAAMAMSQPVAYPVPVYGGYQPPPQPQPASTVQTVQTVPLEWRIFRNRFEDLEVRVHIVGDNPEEYISIPAGGEVSKQLPSNSQVWAEVMAWKGNRQVPTQELGQRELPYHSGWVFFNPIKGEL